MRGVIFLAWSVISPSLVWYLMRRQANREHARLLAENGECRARKETAAIELLELEAKYEARTKTWSEAAEQLDRTIALLDETRKRAETAEGIARGQAQHIEALQRSNDKMLQSITDMRRTGFSLPDDILREASDDRVTTVQDDDREYVSEHPHLAAGDLD